MSQKATCSILEQVQIEGNRSVKRRIEFYNLDAVIAVGYRVNSKQATKFRIWATKTLREYLVKGIIMNADRIKKLPDTILADLAEKLSFIQRTIGNSVALQGLGKDEVDGLLSVIQGYTHSWSVLKEFDEGALSLKKSKATEKRRTCCTSPSRTIRSLTATSVPAHFFLYYFWS